MAENNGLYSIQGSTLTDIADAIRERSGETQQYTPTEMAAAVLAIKGGGIEELPDNLAYLDQTIEDKEFIGYGSSVTVDKTGADIEEINPILQALYPIGSIITMATNTNPAEQLGGTWELVDKEFAYVTNGSLGNYVTLNSNCSAVAGRFTRSGKTLYLAISFTPTVTITDSTLTMFTLDLSSLGVSSLGYTHYPSEFVDAGQSAVACTLTAAGVFSTTDIMVRGSDTASLATGYTLQFFTVNCQINPEHMLDSACDKFYFKRIA